MFGPLATLNARESDWPEAFDELLRGGVFGMLGNDGELTRALAAIGLVNTFTTDINVVRMMSGVLGVDDAAVSEAIDLSPRHGLPLVAKKGRSVLALV
ncbi:MAG TPA: hypothetical protein VJZ76_14865 [Thermoanaerobaculia bacterium]|nr:hypothetical protein [Thermoanaerobaculia bacterium]